MHLFSCLSLLSYLITLLSLYFQGFTPCGFGYQCNPEWTLVTNGPENYICVKDMNDLKTYDEARKSCNQSFADLAELYYSHNVQDFCKKVYFNSLVHTKTDLEAIYWVKGHENYCAFIKCMACYKREITVHCYEKKKYICQMPATFVSLSSSHHFSNTLFGLTQLIASIFWFIY